MARGYAVILGVALLAVGALDSASPVTGEAQRSTQAESGGVTVTRTGAAGRGVRCPSITVDLRSLPAVSSTSPETQVEGGCELVLSGEAVDMHVLTVVEEMLFAECAVEIRIRVDGAGRLGVSEFKVFGGSPCYDVRGCHPLAGKPRPMAGRVVSVAEGLRMEIETCLDTCMGRFEGLLSMQLSSDGRGWRAVADDATIGASGWKLNGGLTTTEPNDLTFRSLP